MEQSGCRRIVAIDDPASLIQDAQHTGADLIVWHALPAWADGQVVQVDMRNLVEAGERRFTGALACAAGDDDQADGV